MLLGAFVVGEVVVVCISLGNGLVMIGLSAETGNFLTRFLVVSLPVFLVSRQHGASVEIFWCKNFFPEWKGLWVDEVDERPPLGYEV